MARPCTFKKALLSANRNRMITAVADADQVAAISRNVAPTLAPAKAVLDKMNRQTSRNILYLGEPDIADEVMAAIDGRRVMIWAEVQKNKVLPIRNITTGWEEGNPIRSTYSIQNQHEYSQRLRKQKPREILYEIPDAQNMAKELIVDLDPQPAFGFEKTKPAAIDLARRLDTWAKTDGVRVYFSGSKGFHLHVDLKKPVDITEGRKLLTDRLKATMDKSKGKWTHSTQKKTEDQLLVDILVNKPRGPIRAPFTPHQKTGLIKVPIDSESELLDFSIKDATTSKARKKLRALRKSLAAPLSDETFEERVDAPVPGTVLLVDTIKPQGLRESWFKGGVRVKGYELRFGEPEPLVENKILNKVIHRTAALQFAIDSQLPPGVHYLHGGNYEPRQWLEKTVGEIDPKNPPEELLGDLRFKAAALARLLRDRNG